MWFCPPVCVYLCVGSNMYGECECVGCVWFVPREFTYDVLPHVAETWRSATCGLTFNWDANTGLQT